MSVDRVADVPVVDQLSKYQGADLLNLLQLRVMCFANNTWLSMISGTRRYRDFCELKKVEPFPVNVVSN